MRPLNNPSPYVLLLITAALVVLCSTQTTNDLVTTSCKPTPDPKLCEATLRSDPRSSKAKDIKALILIMIDVVKTRFSDSVRYVEDLTRKTHDSDTLHALKECTNVYNNVVNMNVRTAIDAVEKGDPKFGEEAMTGSGNEADACRAAFPDRKVPGQIVDQTQMLHGVSNVVASLIKALE